MCYSAQFLSPDAISRNHAGIAEPSSPPAKLAVRDSCSRTPENFASRAHLLSAGSSWEQLLPAAGLKLSGAPLFSIYLNHSVLSAAVGRCALSACICSSL